MKCLQMVLSVVLLALCFHAASAEVVDFEKCPVEEKCIVHKVSITPCPEAEKGNFCTVNSGSNVSITFDYTPKFAADKLSIYAFLTTRQLGFYQIFDGVDKEACKYTNCPLVSGNPQTYTHNFNVGMSLLSGRYAVTWKMTNENDDFCCFTVPIKISKRINLED